MTKWMKILGGIALTAVVAGGTFFWRINGSGSSLASVDPKIKLLEKPCDAAFAPARCGVVIAPLDYNDPTGKTLEIGFVHYPAVGFGSNPTLQIIGGGPGQAITEDAKQGGSEALAATRLLFHDRSLLLIDPRGVGLSTRLECAAYQNLTVHPNDPSLMQLCANQIGSDWQHFTTENTARDFDRVRQALDIAELDLYGFSYGSNLSALYASRFPKHIRSLGMDGALPLTTWSLFTPTHYTAMKRQVQQFCDRSGKCKTDEVLQALSWAADELRKAPRPLDDSAKDERFYPPSFQLDVVMLAGLAADLPQLGVDEKTSSAVWRLPFVSALLKAYRQKNWADLESLAVERLSIKKAAINDPTFASATALNAAITCQDWIVPWKRTSTINQRRTEYKTNAAAYERKHPNAFVPFSAEEWGMRRNLTAYYQTLIDCPVQTTPLPTQPEQTFTWPDSLPVLVVNGDYDFQTVNEDAQLAAAQFKQVQVANFKHHGHAILPASLCASQLLREFLSNERIADPMKCYEADPTEVSLENEK